MLVNQGAVLFVLMNRLIKHTRTETGHAESTIHPGLPSHSRYWPLCRKSSDRELSTYKTENSTLTVERAAELRWIKSHPCCWVCNLYSVLLPERYSRIPSPRCTVSCGVLNRPWCRLLDTLSPDRQTIISLKNCSSSVSESDNSPISIGMEELARKVLRPRCCDDSVQISRLPSLLVWTKVFNCNTERPDQAHDLLWAFSCKDSDTTLRELT